MAAYPWGGSEELWQRAAISLKNSNHTVSAHYHVSRGWHTKMDELVRAGVSVHGYGLKNARLNGWAGALNAKLIGSKISAPYPAPGRWSDADLVVVSQGGISDGLSWLETLRIKKIPYVIVVQANAVASWPNDRQASLLRECYESATKVFFVSQDNLRLFRTQVAYTADNLEVAWNPLNTSTPSNPLPWPHCSNDRLKLAMVGRVEPFAKGQDLALEAFASSSIRDLPISLSIYGQGPWSSTCQRLIEQWSLDNVRMLGHATPNEIWQDHHALLLPSRHEGTSLAMLEALWLGRPVLSTHVAGAISEIIDDKNGYFIRESSAESVADTILKAWHLRSSLQAMGSYAATHIRHRMPHDPAENLAEKIMLLAQ